jgi:cerevisin
MACPHTAGILAYLLSIYPSVKFDPSLADLDMIPQPLTPPSTSAPSLTSVYASVYSVLPSWVGTFLPPPMLVAAVAGEDDEAGEWKTLTPSQLKVALIKLSSKGLLSDLPDQTPNLLIFNNFTSS